MYTYTKDGMYWNLACTSTPKTVVVWWLVAMTMAAMPAAAATATLRTMGTNRRALAMVVCVGYGAVLRCLEAGGQVLKAENVR